MRRYDYMRLIKTENDINFYDLAGIDWNNFEFINRFKNRKLTQNETTRFYNLLVKENYSDFLMEDLVYFCNQIADPFDLAPGQEVKVPAESDLISFMEDESRKFLVF